MKPQRLQGSLAATPATSIKTKLATSRDSNNLTHTTTTNRSSKPIKMLTNPTFHKRRRRRQNSNSGNSTTATPQRRWSSLTDLSKPGAYLTLLLLSTASVACAASASATASSSTSTGSFSSSSPCAPQHWWDPLQNKCTPCTSCQGETIPLRPCQLHTDTICGSIYDLKIDWVVLAKTEPNWKERRKSSEYEHFDQPQSLQHLTHEQLQQLHDEAAAAWALDWQTSVLYIAVLTCLIFFTVAACILIHHMRQWRRMERRLDQDVEELSTKLMAKLAEVQSLDGGTFFIGNADALRGLPASAAAAATLTSASGQQHHHHAVSATQSGGIFQPQHVLLPDKQAKHHERRILRALQPGNVYIEENNKG